MKKNEITQNQNDIKKSTGDHIGSGEKKAIILFSTFFTIFQ